MPRNRRACLNCEQEFYNRRDFLKVAGAGTAALVAAGVKADDASTKRSSSKPPETAVKRLYESLSDEQKQESLLRLGV